MHQFVLLQFDPAVHHHKFGPIQLVLRRRVLGNQALLAVQLLLREILLGLARFDSSQSGVDGAIHRSDEFDRLLQPGLLDTGIVVFPDCRIQPLHRRRRRVDRQLQIAGHNPSHHLALLDRRAFGNVDLFDPTCEGLSNQVGPRETRLTPLVHKFPDRSGSHLGGQDGHLVGHLGIHQQTGHQHRCQPHPQPDPSVHRFASRGRAPARTAVPAVGISPLSPLRPRRIPAGLGRNASLHYSSGRQAISLENGRCPLPQDHARAVPLASRQSRRARPHPVRRSGRGGAATVRGQPLPGIATRSSPRGPHPVRSTAGPPPGCPPNRNPGKDNLGPREVPSCGGSRGRRAKTPLGEPFSTACRSGPRQPKHIDARQCVSPGGGRNGHGGGGAERVAGRPGGGRSALPPDPPAWRRGNFPRQSVNFRRLFYTTCIGLCNTNGLRARTNRRSR